MFFSCSPHLSPLAGLDNAPSGSHCLFPSSLPPPPPSKPSSILSYSYAIASIASLISPLLYSPPPPIHFLYTTVRIIFLKDKLYHVILLLKPFSDCLASMVDSLLTHHGRPWLLLTSPGPPCPSLLFCTLFYSRPLHLLLSSFLNIWLLSILQASASVSAP